MSKDPTSSSADSEELLCRLADELKSHPENATIDFREIAEKMGVDVNEAARCAAAIDAMHRSFEEDFPGTTDATSLEPPDLPPPSLPADYKLLDEIGRGGMGVVYRVHQRSLDRTVAAKVLRPGELLFGNAIHRFQLEARSLARLRHRHIVSVHEVGEAGGNVYFTMDLIDGEPLSKLIERRETTPARSVRLLRQVTSAMAHAHSQGVIHRDLKPGNILVDKTGDAFVVDFGLARDVGAGESDTQTTLTRTGHVLGTPAYMSPEQARGEQSRVGEACDIYALGAVLYECLTGRQPFHGLSLAETVHAVIHKDPTPLRRLNPSTPRDLEVICLKAMSKEPEHRYATVRALLEDLERFEEGKMIRARPPKLTYRALRFLKRNRHASVSSVLAATGVTLALLAFLLPRLGRTPESLLETGEELHDAGQHVAAYLVFDNALEELGAPGSGDYSSPLAQGLLHTTVRCRNEEAAKLWQQGEEAKAKDLTQQSVDLCVRGISNIWGDPESEWGRVKENTGQMNNAALANLLWEKANAHSIAGNSYATERTLKRLSSVITPPRQGTASLQAGWHEEDNATGFLDRLLPVLLDPQAPRHGIAARALVTLFPPGAVGSWMSRQGESTGPLIRAYLSGFGKLPAVKAGPLEQKLNSDPGNPIDHLAAFHSEANWGRFYFHIALPEYAEIFEKAAADSALSAKSRSLAVDLLCAVGDLPVRLPIQDIWDLFSRDLTGKNPEAALSHPELERLALGLWREVRDMSFVEGYRRRVESALELYKPGAFVLESKWEDSWKALRNEWLRGHTGLSHSFFRGSAEEQHNRLQRWWQEHRLEDPRAWLVRSLRLEAIPEKSDVTELLNGLLHATDVTAALNDSERMENFYDRDRLYDQLLRLTVSTKLHPPTLQPSNLLNIPNFPLITQRWTELFQTHLPTEPYTLRAVALGFRPGSLEPKILWQQTSTKRLAIGEELLVEFPREKTAAIPGTRWSFHGWDVVRMLPRTSSHNPVRSRGDHVRARLLYSGGELTSHFRVTQGSTTNGFPNHVGVPLLCRRTETETIFTVLEPPGSDPQPWTLDGLRKRIVDGLTFQAAHTYHSPPNGDERHIVLEVKRYKHFARQYRAGHRCLLVLATLIQVPEAAASLKRLFRLVAPESHRRRFKNLERDVTALRQLEVLNLQARLLSGEDVFSDLKQQPEFTLQTISPIYWARMSLNTRSPQLRTFALEQLKGREMTIVEASALSTALKTGEIKVSNVPWLEHQVATTIREHRELEEQTGIEPWAAVSVAIAGVIDLLALATLVALIWPGRRPIARLSAANRLVVLGLLLVLVGVGIGGQDVLENFAGLGLAAVGAWYLALAGKGRARFLTPMALTLALLAETLQRTEILTHELSFSLAGLGILGLPFLARGLNLRVGKANDPFGLFVTVFTLLIIIVDFSPRIGQESNGQNLIGAIIGSLLVGAFLVRGGFLLQSAIRKRAALEAPLPSPSGSQAPPQGPRP